MHWIVRVFIENGIALFSSWMTIATIINILDLVVYEDSFEHVQAVMRGKSFRNFNLYLFFLWHC